MIHAATPCVDCHTLHAVEIVRLPAMKCSIFRSVGVDARKFHIRNLAYCSRSCVPYCTSVAHLRSLTTCFADPFSCQDGHSRCNTTVVSGVPERSLEACVKIAMVESGEASVSHT